MNKLTTRFSHPLKGLYYALRHDRSFQSQFFGGLLCIIVLGWLFSPLAAWEWIFIGLCWTLVLITELQNSAFEEALNRLHPELHETIGRSKDMAAGAVLLAAVYTVAVVVILSAVRLLGS